MDVHNPSNFAISDWEGLTCQHISHNGIPEKQDAVDDIPEALEVGEKVVDCVGRRLQRNFDPGEEIGCKSQGRN